MPVYQPMKDYVNLRLNIMTHKNISLEKKEDVKIEPINNTEREHSSAVFEAGKVDVSPE